MSKAKASAATIIFHRFGPYHYARLEAASRVVGLSAIQGCRRDTTYPWEEVKSQGCLPVATLFEDADSSAQRSVVVRRRMRDQLKRSAPSVVVVPGWSGGLAFSALEWGLANARPVVLMSESTQADQPRVRWKEWVKHRLVSLCSSALVGGAPHAAYIARLGMDRERVFQGYDVVDNDYFSYQASQVRSLGSQLRTRCQLPENYFLASSRFIEKKNLPRLLEAYARYRALAASPSAAKVRPTTPLWSLVLLGDGPLRTALKSQVSSLSLHDHVQMPGFKQYPTLPTYYALASAFVHASTSEQWGLVVNEALASGLPVLVSNTCGCAPDLVQEGVNGFTFDPYDVEELAGLMLKVSSLGPQLPAMGSASRRIVADWGPERFASGLRSAIDKAIEVGPKKATLLDRVMLRALMYRRMPYPTGT